MGGSSDRKIKRSTWEPVHGLRITPPEERLSEDPDIRDYQLARYRHEFEGGEEPVAPRRPVVLDAPLFGGKKKLGTLPYNYAPVVEKALNLAYGQKTLPLYFNRMTTPIGIALDAYEASKFVGRDPKDVKNYTGIPGLVMNAGRRTLPFIGLGAGAGASDVVAEDREERAEGGDVPMPPQRPRDLLNYAILADAQRDFPFINKHNPHIKVSPGTDRNYAETFGPDEEGSKEFPRPKEFPYGATGIEVYKPEQFTPADYAAEFLHVDPFANKTREQMIRLYTPEQRELMKRGGDYQETIARNLGERKALENATDALLRAYSVQNHPSHQWHKDELYDLNFTPEQLKVLDNLKTYVEGSKRARGGAVEHALRLARRKGGPLEDELTGFSYLPSETRKYPEGVQKEYAPNPVQSLLDKVLSYGMREPYKASPEDELMLRRLEQNLEGTTTPQDIDRQRADITPGSRTAMTPYQRTIETPSFASFKREGVPRSWTETEKGPVASSSDFGHEAMMGSTAQRGHRGISSHDVADTVEQGKLHANDLMRGYRKYAASHGVVATDNEGVPLPPRRPFGFTDDEVVGRALRLADRDKSPLFEQNSEKPAIMPDHEQPLIYAKGGAMTKAKEFSRGGYETESAPLPSKNLGRRSWETDLDRLRRMMEETQKGEDAYGPTPYKEGGYVDNKAVKNALRLAKEGKFRLHQTLARTGYASGGIANDAAKKLIEEIDAMLPHRADEHFAKGGKASQAPVYAEPEPGTDAYWDEKHRIYAKPYSERELDPKDPLRYISPKEYQKGSMGRGEFVMANGGRADLASGGNPTPQKAPIKMESKKAPTSKAPSQLDGVNSRINELMMSQPLQVQLAALLRQEGDQYLNNLNNPSNVKELAAIGYTPFTRAAAGTFKENTGKGTMWSGWFDKNDPSSPTSQMLAPSAYSAMKSPSLTEAKKGLIKVQSLINDPNNPLNVKALEMANKIINREVANPTPGATNYYNPAVYKTTPDWAKTLAKYKLGTASESGKHIYFTNPQYAEAINKNMDQLFANVQLAATKGKPANEVDPSLINKTPITPTTLPYTPDEIKAQQEKLIATDKAAWDKMRNDYMVDRINKGLPATLPPELTNYVIGAGGTMPSTTGGVNVNPNANTQTGVPNLGSQLTQSGAGGNVAGTGMVNPGGNVIGGTLTNPNVGTAPPVWQPAGTGTTSGGSVISPIPGTGMPQWDYSTGLTQNSPIYMGNTPPLKWQAGDAFSTGISGGYQPSVSLPPGVFTMKRGGAVKADKEDVENAVRLAKGGRRVNARIDKDPALDMSLKSGGGAWTRAEGKDPEGGLNEKGRRSLKAQGHDIKRPQPEGGPRRDSFCARMKGMKAKLTSAETANDPDSRINKSLRAWNCADGGEVWDNPRPKNLGDVEALSKSQKKSAKASAKSAGRPYPNLVDNMRAAQRKK